MKNILTLIALMISVLAWAQPKEKVGSVEINVFESYKANIKEARKITGQPNYADSTTEKLSMKYEVRPKGLSFGYNPRPIPAAKIGKVRVEKFPSNEITLGVGNYITSFAEINTGSNRSRDHIWNARFSHFRTQTGVSDILFDKNTQTENNLEAYYKKLYRSSEWKTTLNGDFRLYSLYGMPSIENVSDTSVSVVPGLKQRTYNRVGLDTRYKYTGNSSNEYFRGVGLSYDFYFDNVQNQAHRGFVDSDWNIKAGGQEVNLELGFDYNHTTFEKVGVYQMYVPRLKPTIQTSLNKMGFTLGFNVAVPMVLNSFPPEETKTKVGFYPVISAQIPLVSEVLSVYLGVDGDAQLNDIWSLSQVNPYLSDDVSLNSTSNMKVYTGIRGKASTVLSYNFQFKHQWNTDYAFFYRSPNGIVDGTGDPSFKVIYDNLMDLRFKGEIGYENKGWEADLFAAYHVYSGFNKIAKAYNLPEIESGLAVSYLWKKKIKINTDLIFIGERYAFDPANETEFVKAKLDPYLDARLGAEYFYNANLSAGINVTNLLSSPYQQWLGYSAQRIRFLISLSYKF